MEGAWACTHTDLDVNPASSLRTGSQALWTVGSFTEELKHQAWCPPREIVDGQVEEINKKYEESCFRGNQKVL